MATEVATHERVRATSVAAKSVATTMATTTNEDPTMAPARRSPSNCRMA